jgi:hypothetical protein
MKKLIASLLPSLVFGLAPAGARAETNSCSLLAGVPITVSTPGIYCLTSDIVTNMASGYAITINAPNVVLDLNAHRLANTAGPTNIAGAILSSEARITIKNGAIRGFLNGVSLLGSSFDSTQAHLIEDLRIDQTRLPIRSSGPALIRRNWITGVESNPPATISTAMYLNGDGTRVIDNDILGVTPPPGGTGYGILVTAADVLIVNNRITDSRSGSSSQRRAASTATT